MSDQPRPNSVWQHKNGAIYRVLFITNTDHQTDQHLPTVVYQNTKNGTRWSRLASDWHRSFTPVESPEDQPRPTPRTDAVDKKIFHSYATHYRLMLLHARELERESDARAEEIKELREIIGRDQLGKACIYWMDRYHKLAQSDDNPDNRQTISVPKILIPNGGRLVECYETEREFVICGEVDSDDESHDCDSMGCGSFSHVIARIPKVDLEQGWPIERAENTKLREALAPSAETKAAYMGEFSFEIEEFDEDCELRARKVEVPWTTIKEIMAAISRQALAGKEEGQ